ncbi:MAG: hypothetical protein ACRD8Z_05585, partial [Nitrososphaeraceae archaeon]
IHCHDRSSMIEEIGSFVIVDSNVFVDLIYKAYLEKPCENCNKLKIYVDSYSVCSGSPTVLLSCHSRGCIWTKKIKCSLSVSGFGPSKTQFNELPARMVYSFLLAGLCNRNYDEVLTLLDVDHLTAPQFQKYGDKLHDVVQNLLHPILKQNRDKLRYQVSNILMIDGRWSSRGWNANECTVSVFNAVSKELLYVDHILRKLNHNDKHGNYIGASSAMEGFSLERICQHFKSENLSIDMIVHDHDAESLKIIQKYFPEAGEYFDVAHKGKNLKKKIIKLKKSFPSLTGFGDRVLKSFMWCLRNCCGDVTEFKILMTNQYNHFCDIDHTTCQHASEYIPKWSFITDEDTRIVLWKEYKEVIDKADKYVKRFGTNIAESFNNVISKYCNKRLNFHPSYCLRANLAAFQYVMPHYKYEIFKNLGLKISNKLKKKIFEEVVKKEKQHNKRQMPEYIEKTKINRYKKRKRNCNKPGQHEYKGKKVRPLTIKQLKEKIEILGVKMPSKLKKHDDIEKFYEDLIKLPNCWVEIEPLDIDELDLENETDELVE